MIVVVVEVQDERPTGLSLEALTLARAAGAVAGMPLEAIGVPRDGSPATGRAKALAAFIEARDAPVVVAPGSDTATELLAHVAALRALPMAANVTAVEVARPIRVTRQRWGGTLLEEATIDARPALLTVAPHAVTADATAVDGLHLAPLEAGPADDRVRLVDRVQLGRAGMSLQDARVVVGGGRGVGSAEGFALLDELAALLGGTVGVSRAVTSAGWRPHDEQVGQTGARIAPDLYLACGISGAVQHIVGCRGARRILAINTDPDAPMVAAADWAVIGDLHAVLPPLIAALRNEA